MSTKSRRWVLKQAFDGFPKREDFEIVEEDVPPLKDGEFKVEALWLTVDPYMRVLTVAGNTMPGSQVAKVIESKNKDYSVGDIVCGHFGWQTISVSDGDASKHFLGLYKVDPNGPHPLSTALGILGMPGATAYFGLQDICKPIKEGETLIVNAAAGAVGAAVGQIGKIRGMRVVGFAGSDEKVEYLKSIGFDAAFNYKTVTLADAIKEGCPNGVDVFFDNVGGKFFETVVPQMNDYGRISICGVISQYNLKEEQKLTPINSYALWKQLRFQGFMCTTWLNEWPVAFKELSQWISEGKLQYKEIVFEGFDQMYDAFASLFDGSNKVGKVVIKC